MWLWSHGSGCSVLSEQPWHWVFLSSYRNTSENLGELFELSEAFTSVILYKIIFDFTQLDKFSSYSGRIYLIFCFYHYVCKSFAVLVINRVLLLLCLIYKSTEKPIIPLLSLSENCPKKITNVTTITFEVLWFHRVMEIRFLTNQMRFSFSKRNTIHPYD